MKEKMKQDLHTYKWLVTLHGLGPTEAVAAAQSLYAQGVRFVAVDFDGDATQCAETLLTVYRFMGEKMYVGADGVTTHHRLIGAMEHGAAFVCSPDAQIVSSVAEGIPCITGNLAPSQTPFAIAGVTAVDMTGGEWKVL